MRKKNWYTRFGMLFVALLLLITTASLPFAAAAEPPKLGIVIDESGTMLLNGKPYRAYGMNYFDAFIGLLRGTTTVEEVESEFAILQKYKIPAVRIMMCGFYPNEVIKYQDMPKEYFAKMDSVVALAEKYEVGIIADLFWCFHSIPDLCNESMTAASMPGSRSIKMASEYAAKVITRYKKSPAIWAWEIGNEYSLAADLHEVIPPDYNTLHFAGISGGKTPRTTADNMTSAHFQSMNREVSKAMRAADPTRMLTGGESEPRTAAYHLFKFNRWDKDTPDEMGMMMNMFCPSPLNTMSVHFYQDDMKAATLEDFDTQMRDYIAQSRKYKKGLLVGEFGAMEIEMPGEQPARQARASEIIKSQMAAIYKHGAQLAFMWVYGKNDGDPMDIIPGVQNAYQFDLVLEGNRQFVADGVQDTEAYWKDVPKPILNPSSELPAEEIVFEETSRNLNSASENKLAGSDTLILITVIIASAICCVIVAATAVLLLKNKYRKGT